MVFVSAPVTHVTHSITFSFSSSLPKPGTDCPEHASSPATRRFWRSELVPLGLIKQVMWSSSFQAHTSSFAFSKPGTPEAPETHHLRGKCIIYDQHMCQTLVEWITGIFFFPRRKRCYSAQTNWILSDWIWYLRWEKQQLHAPTSVVPGCCCLDSQWLVVSI